MPVHLTHRASPTLRRHLYTTSLYTTGVRQFYTTSLYTTRPRGYTSHLPIKFVPSRSLWSQCVLVPGPLGSWVPRPRVPVILFPDPSFSNPQGQSKIRKTQAKANTSRHKRKQNQSGGSKSKSKHKQSKGAQAKTKARGHKQKNTQKQTHANT